MAYFWDWVVLIMSAIQQLYVGGTYTLPPQVAYTEPGTYTWICPPGVTSVSAVCVGAGGSTSIFYNNYSGAGGALGYKNNMTVVPGTGYTVIVGQSFCNNTGNTFSGSSSFMGITAGGGSNGDSIFSRPGGTYSGTGVLGGNGGSSGTNGGGGGAGGYSGSGGDGKFNADGLAGAGGGGGGGGGTNQPSVYTGGNGGGVGLLGAGASGAGGLLGTLAPGGDGGPGSGGSGKNYGGGAGYPGSPGSNVIGSHGAVRIIWPGNLRLFPSTRTANE